MDLGFLSNFSGKGISALFVCMKNNNMPGCAPTREGREFDLAAVIREGELADLQFNGGDVAEYAEFLLIKEESPPRSLRLVPSEEDAVGHVVPKPVEIPNRRAAVEHAARCHYHIRI